MDINSTHPVAEVLQLYGITEEDLALVKSYGEIVIPKLPDYVKHFYEWQKPLPEYAEYFSDADRLHRVQKQQIVYWTETFQGVVNQDYVDRRRKLGESHARVDLSLPTYFAGMSQSLSIFSEKLYDQSLTEKEYAKTLISIAKMVHLDTALVVEAYTIINREKVEKQNQAMMEMSIPVTSIWDGVLMLPIVGVLDSKRAQDLMHAVLTEISNSRARVIILDISGVAVVDTAVANHIIKITKASKLMGCNCTVSGVSPAIAQTIVELGIDVGTMSTTSTLRDALDLAFSTVGVCIVEK